ncbi:hypothetical protein BJY52DRAFT_1314164 [Lactarius psammicola]|nr:hypothetical protein BJY52DRAFT_1314164 [Lactarius psammicola]
MPASPIQQSPEMQRKEPAKGFLDKTLRDLCLCKAWRHQYCCRPTGASILIPEGLANFPSTTRWFDHNDLKSLEDVLLGVESECRKCCGPLMRGFIVAEGKLCETWSVCGSRFSSSNAAFLLRV